MSHGPRAGRQEVARKRRRQRQILRIAGAVIGVTILAIAAMLILGRSDDEVEPVVADVPEPTGEATWTVDAFTGGPRLAVDRTEHNEGAVAYGQEVQAAFRLKNVGDEPLTLDEISVNTLEGC